MKHPRIWVPAIAVLLVLLLAGLGASRDCGDGSNGMGATAPGNSTTPSGAVLSLSCPGSVSVPRYRIAPDAEKTGPTAFCVGYYGHRLVQVEKEQDGCGGYATGDDWHQVAGWGYEWEFVLKGTETPFSSICGTLVTIQRWCVQPISDYRKYVIDGSTSVTCTVSGGFPPYHFASEGTGVTVDAETGLVTVLGTAGSSYGVSLEDEAAEQRTSGGSVSVYHEAP